jgi:hypothetical protein
MVLTNIETRSAESRAGLSPSRFQEWNNIQLLGKLWEQLRSLEQDELDFLDSDLAAITGVTDTSTDDDLRKVSLLFIGIIPKIPAENETRIYDVPQEELSQFRDSIHRHLVVPDISKGVEELLDWDTHIETPPPPRRSGTIKVKFRYIGRSKPISIDDPWT